MTNKIGLKKKGQWKSWKVSIIENRKETIINGRVAIDRIICLYWEVYPADLHFYFNNAIWIKCP